MPEQNEPSVARPREKSRDANSPSPLAAQVRSLRLPTQEPVRGGAPWFSRLVALAAIAGCVWLYVQWRAARLALAKLQETGVAESPLANPGGGASSVPRGAAIASAGDIALEYSGYVIPAHQILVSPQVSGRLLKLSVEEGRRVNKGDLLAEIDRTEYKADLARAVATLALNKQRLLELEHGNRPEEIEQARAELAEFTAQLGQLAAEYKRSLQLVKNSLIPTQDFEVTEGKYRAMERRVQRASFALKLMEEGPRQERIDSAQAEVEQAEAEVTKARWKLDNCSIPAPISGTILKKNAEEGNIVNPVAFNGSFSICELADLSDLEVSLDVQERDIANVFPGQRCRVRASEAYPDRSYEGTVSRLMPIADRAKGSIQVRVKIKVPADEEGVYLKPEMSAKVTFLGARPEAAPDVGAAPGDPTEAGIGLPSATSGSKSTADEPEPAAPPASSPPTGAAESPDTTEAPESSAASGPTRNLTVPRKLAVSPESPPTPTSPGNSSAVPSDNPATLPRDVRDAPTSPPTRQP